MNDLLCTLQCVSPYSVWVGMGCRMNACAFANRLGRSVKGDGCREQVKSVCVSASLLARHPLTARYFPSC